MDAFSLFGEYLERILEIRHSVFDGSRVKSTYPTGSDEKKNTSVSQEGTEDIHVMPDQPIKRARKEPRKCKSIVRKLKNRVNDEVTKPKVLKSKAVTVVVATQM